MIFTNRNFCIYKSHTFNEYNILFDFETWFIKFSFYPKPVIWLANIQKSLEDDFLSFGFLSIFCRKYENNKR